MNRFLLIKPVLLIIIVASVLPGRSQIELVPYDSVEIHMNDIPLSNPWAGGLNCPQFSEIDLNGDGIKDLVAFERDFYGAIKTYINLGTENVVNYVHDPQYQVYFPLMRNWMLLRDYNCDGKEDIFTQVPAGIAVYENIGEDNGPPKFAKVVSLLQTQGLNGQVPLYCNTADIPSITDIDNDGDLDILSFNELGSTLEYHKNLSMENYGNCDELEYELRNTCWGYFSEDGNNNSVTLFDTCEVNVPDPEKSAKHAGSTVLALDLNGNGVKDLLLGDISYNNIVRLTNGGTTSSSSMVDFETNFPSNSAAVNLTVFPAPYHLDVNNDGIKDLLVAPNNPNTSKNFDNIWYYKNNSTGVAPDFEFQKNNFLQDEMIDVGENAFPVFFDENADGLLDIVVGNFGYYIETGNYSSQLMLLRNTGTHQEPSFKMINENYADLAGFSLNGIYPSFGDMDNDGDEDMITGDEAGNLHYFRNDGGAGNPADFTISQPNYKGIDVGESAKPQIIDVNRDGLPDMLVGERSGTINYFENVGTPEVAEFNTDPTNDFFGKINVLPEGFTGYSAPFIQEDSVGNYLLYVGSEQGWLFMYNNIENNLENEFNLVDSLYLFGVNINVSGTDINADGKTEMVYGELAGGIGLLKVGTPQGVGIQKYNREQINVIINPNPADSYIYISLDEKMRSQGFRIVLFNAFGHQIKNYDFTNSTGKQFIDVRGFSRGIYFVRLISESAFGTAKFIKK
jgi:hypothetical protein